MELKDVAMEAQAAFSLGNTFMLMKDFDKAVEYLTRHLKIARDLSDKVSLVVHLRLDMVHIVFVENHNYCA